MIYHVDRVIKFQCIYLKFININFPPIDYAVVYHMAHDEEVVNFSNCHNIYNVATYVS